MLLLLLVSVSHSVTAQSVGLVLSGGGAKGLSHIGVIKALEENNIPIDYIAGTSMGAIIAALYSIGITPDEMLIMFRSPEFNSWYKGEFEKGYATYIYRREFTAEMLGVPIRRDNMNRIGIKLPTSLVAPYPMDLAVLQLFASSSAAINYDFNNLMVPYRCVAADIANKRPHVLRKGNLGSAVRASMTYPFLFKPIIIDSILLFDGGFYNNFPWDVMIKDFDPDFIIGSKCSSNVLEPDTEDIISQIGNMLTVETNYSIPEERGVLIDINLPGVGIMDFHRVDDIMKIGYTETQKFITGLKSKIERRVTESEITQKRMDFRVKTLPLLFKDVIILGDNLNSSEKDFIKRTIKNNSDNIFNFDQLKRGFYRVVATENINTIYPEGVMRSDSLFDLYLRVTKQSPMKLSIGGNISSSSLNQGYLGFQYNQFSKNPWRATADINMGRYYSGLNLMLRQDIGVNPLWFYEAQMTLHRFDYFAGGQTEFFANRVPSNIQESELFLTLSAGTPISIERNLLAKLFINTGRNLYEYYQTDNYTTYDIPDMTNFTYFSPGATIERNTTNYKLYPTEGKKQKFSVRYSIVSEEHRPGSTSPTRTEIKKSKHYSYSARLYSEQYYHISSLISIGVLADISFSNRTYMGDHISTLLYMPAFTPNPHSKTLLLNGYRAPSYAGVAVTPIIKLSYSFSVQLQAAYFQAYRQLIENSEGVAKFTGIFPRGAFMGNVAAVWQSPVGPVSLSATYYQKSQVKWYPQLNIGFLIFKPKALAN
ncbi:MAG: patatin-like phospholipase family protein [Bacteroidales bacterium]|nr:patatin-like phospholipase family protein [Bacteroidales bacterium]